MKTPTRPPDEEHKVSPQELAQALADWLVREGRMRSHGTSEATDLRISLDGGPHTFLLWLKPSS